MYYTTCVCSELKLDEASLGNELYLSLPCSTGSWTIDSFYHFTMLNNNFKEIMNCKIVICKLLQ